MKHFLLACLCAALLAIAGPGSGVRAPVAEPHTQAEIEKLFLGVPDPKVAEEDLRVLTAAPHIAGSPEDKKTADFVAQKFREAGLETEIVEYKVWINYPSEISVDVVAPPGVKMHGPRPERVSSDPYQDDPRIVVPYSGFSPSGDAEAEVVYANYGRLEDFKRLEEMKIDVRGKIVIARYGTNYRGVKALLAQQFGAAGLLLYSDPLEDGYFKGDPYPKGPWRPASGVQRGSVGYSFNIPGDPTTPGIASVPGLPQSKRTPPQQAEMPKVPSTPLSWADAEPILKHLTGPESPRDWQGALPFTYHVGPGPVRVRMHLKQDYAYRSIWDVIGRVPGSVYPDEWVLAGNHRDAWVFGAVDPGSGTVAMLEAVRGIGRLLKSGWRPKRTLIFGSWDGEEHGLMGSTEWAEQHAAELNRAVAYLNMDSAVAGANFGASAVPSLKQFLRDVSKAVPSPKGGTVYQAWRAAREKPQQPDVTGSGRIPVVQLHADVPVGDLGSGSDYTPFLQHLGIACTDMASSGSYGVYHSAFDDLAWFKRFADPDFAYEQQMARLFGIEVLRFADAGVLPYDYETYGKEIAAYIHTAQGRAEKTFAKPPSSDAVLAAAERFARAGAAISRVQPKDAAEAAAVNRALREAERALLLPHGLPGRPWFRHAIYAPGRYAGYAAAVIPGVNEALDAGDLAATEQQLAALTAALNRAASVLERPSSRGVPASK
jgi:N-acetylated-alpha-linked acidic dipeptidase